MKNEITKEFWREATVRYGAWIHRKAKKFACQLAPHIASNIYEELVGVGFRGFVEAMHKTDFDRTECLDAYIKQIITGAMLDELRRLDPLSRDQRKQQRQLRMVERSLVGKLGRTPTEDEMACASKKSVPEYRKLLQENTPHMVSLDAPVRHEGESLVSQMADASVKNPLEEALHKEHRKMLKQALDRLPHRYRFVLKKYYFEGQTLQDIGNGMKVCAARASQIRREAVQRLRRELSVRLAS